MDFKALISVFSLVFLSELGDKTQLATILFAADSNMNPMTVFLGASLALVLSSALGVFAGAMLTKTVSPYWLKIVSGFGFICMGCFILLFSK